MYHNSKFYYKYIYVSFTKLILTHVIQNKHILDVVYVCERKIDPTHIGTLSKIGVEEWKKIIEKCITTNGDSIIIKYSIHYYFCMTLS